MISRTLCYVALLTTSLLAQAPAVPATAAAMDAATGLHPTAAGGWIGLGPDYKVDFAADGAVFTPVLGAVAPHDLPLRWTVRHVGRDTLRPVGPAVRREGERQVDYVRPEFVEQLDVRADGLKQSFVFDTLPPGGGDLVVRATVDTMLEAPTGTTDAGLSFTLPGCGGVRIGQVVGFDADGRSAPGSLRWNGSELDFVLPAAFVDGARLPLVVDPLLSSLTAVTSGTIEDRAPVVAHHDSSFNVYLVVWRRTISAANHDVMAVRVAAVGGAVTGGLLGLETTPADAGAPQVAEAGH